MFEALEAIGLALAVYALFGIMRQLAAVGALLAALANHLAEIERSLLK